MFCRKKRFIYLFFIILTFYINGNLLLSVSLDNGNQEKKTQINVRDLDPSQSYTTSDVLFNYGNSWEDLNSVETFADGPHNSWKDSSCAMMMFIDVYSYESVYQGEYAYWENIFSINPDDIGYNCHIFIPSGAFTGGTETGANSNVLQCFIQIDSGGEVLTENLIEGQHLSFETFNYIINSGMLLRTGVRALKDHTFVPDSLTGLSGFSLLLNNYLFEKWEPNIVCSDVFRLEEWYSGVPSNLYLNLTNVGKDVLYEDEDFYVKIWPNGSSTYAFTYFIDVPYDIESGDDFQIEIPFTPHEDGGFWFYVDVDVTDTVKELGEEMDTNSDDVRHISGILDVQEPFVSWETPQENAHILFPKGNSSWFNFTYDWLGIDEVNLTIEGLDFGSVWGVNTKNLTYSFAIDGNVTATLHGYNKGIEIVSDSRDFKFGKIRDYYYQLLEHNYTYLGDQLYLILHDPGGDHSFSSFQKETTNLSIGVDFEIQTEQNDEWKGFEITPSFKYFSLGSIGSKQELHESEETIEEFDFRLQITNTTFLTSSKESEDANFIGPGYGDRYWGEAWTIRYDILEYNCTYYNWTVGHIKNQMNYWITGENEVFLNHQNAPEEWKALNPVVNGYENVTWIKELNYNGGGVYSETHKVKTTDRWKKSYEFQLSKVTKTKLMIWEGTGLPGTDPGRWTLNEHRKNYNETQYNHEITTYFEIYDDESNDIIHQKIGIDRLFSTYIFQMNESFSFTSEPLEFNSTDYIPPEISDPIIQYDTNNDGMGPNSDDTPKISVEIYEEDKMQQVWAYYNDGSGWEYIILNEILCEDKIYTFEGNLPSRPHDTVIQWYLKAWDKEGSETIKKDIYGEPYSYIIGNGFPTVRIIYPNSGEILSGTVVLQWNASDPDNDALIFTLAYNRENTGWHLIAENISGTSYTWDVSSIPASDSVLLRIIAYDGYGGETIDYSDYVFSITHPSTDTNETPPYELIVIGAVIGAASFIGVAGVIWYLRKRVRP